MSMLGVPYSPIVPSFTRCAFGATSRIAQITFMQPSTLLRCVSHAWSRSIIEYGADGISP